LTVYGWTAAEQLAGKLTGALLPPELASGPLGLASCCGEAASGRDELAPESPRAALPPSLAPVVLVAPTDPEEGVALASGPPLAFGSPAHGVVAAGDEHPTTSVGSAMAQTMAANVSRSGKVLGGMRADTAKSSHGVTYLPMDEPKQCASDWNAPPATFDVYGYRFGRTG
jgi:hypothetical protein